MQGLRATLQGMSKGRAVLVGVAAAVLAGCLLASFLTRGAMAHLPLRDGQGGAEQQGLADESPWQTVAALAPLATSTEEKGLAREAERLADHEVDQAFAMALRQAEMEKAVLTGPALDLQQKVNGLAEQVKEDQAAVDSLTSKLAAVTKSGAAAANSVSDDLDVAKGQLQLDTDEMNDASEDLAHASGDQRGEIQQELAAREASMQKYDSQANSGGEPAVVSVKRYGTLAGRIGARFDQRSREGSGGAGEGGDGRGCRVADGAARGAGCAVRARRRRRSRMRSAARGAGAGAAGGSDAKGKLARMARVHELAQIHSILEDRLDTEKQLSAVYAKWIGAGGLAAPDCDAPDAAVDGGGCRADPVRGAGVVAGATAAGPDGRSCRDGPSQHAHLRTVVSLAIEVVTLVLALLLVFGAPNQMPTILGLGAAGLTVVFQDFILAFFGWFVLMGKNGIRVGDWVEINGVGGEVVEVGLFRTALLETGNWTAKGHPTGRRVMFMNSFAVTGQFFNFSTAGQWMWDEISLNVPAGEGTYKTIEAIHKAVLEQTAEDAKLAETEWKGAARSAGPEAVFGDAVGGYAAGGVVGSTSWCGT
jgi:hypothetical protein